MLNRFYISLLCLLGGAAFAQTAQAQNTCKQEELSNSPEIGEWRRASDTLKELVGVSIEAECVDGAAVYKARAFTKCAPRDCKWGWVEGQRTLTNKLVFYFPGFFKSQKLTVSSMHDRVHVSVHAINANSSGRDQYYDVILQRE